MLWLKAVPVLALLSVAASCATGARASTVLKAVAVDERVNVRLPGETEWKQLKRGDTVPAGAEVRTLAGARAELESVSASYELASSTWLDVQQTSRVVLKTGQLLARGPKLVTVDGGEGRTVEAAGSTVRVDYGDRAAVYRGIARVTLPSGAIEVPAGLELNVVLDNPVPRAIAIDRNDRWDQRLLGDAIRMDGELEPYAKAFDVNTAGAGPSVDFLARFVPRPLVAFMDPLFAAEASLRSASKFQVLVQVFIAIEHAILKKATRLDESFAAVRSLVARRATLGLTAQMLGVHPDRLLARVIRALNPSAPQPSNEPILPGPSARPTPGRSGPTPTAQPTGSRRPRPSPTPTSEPTDDPTESPSPSPSPSPSCDILAQVQGTCGGGGTGALR